MREFVFIKDKYGFELLMDLHRFQNNPNLDLEPLPHTTNFFEIFVFEQGHGHIELNGYYLPLQDRSLFFISPFQKKCCHIETEGLKGFHLVFENDFLANFFEDKLFVYRQHYFYNSLCPQYLRLTASDYALIKTMFEEIIQEIANYQSDSPHLIRSLLYYALTKLNRLYARAHDLSDKSQQDNLTYRFKETLEQHIRSQHSVSFYCQALNVSRHQLNKAVRASYRHTTKEVIEARLAQEIKLELCYTDKTVAEIAYELGFSEPNNLSRFFKRIHKLYPIAFRKQYQDDRDLA